MNGSEPEEEFITNDTPFYDTHNNTIIIEGGVIYLFNVIISSVLVIGALSGCYKVVARARKCMNDYRHVSSLDNYLLSHQDQEAATDGSCSICIEPFNSPQATVVLRYNHKFHNKCIKEWLEKELTCPNCRAPLVI